MNPIRTILLDDEEPALLRLKTLFESDKDFNILSSCSKSADALKVLLETPVDLLVLDIEMPDMNGLELLSKLDNKNKLLVVFVTAYDEYAVRAFEYYAIDYILKPFSNERFQKMMARVKEHFINHVKVNISWGDVKNSIEQGVVSDKIAVRTGKKYSFIDPVDIMYVSAAGNYCEIYLHSGAKHVHRDTLAHVSTVLPSNQFIRIHHSYIVSVRSVSQLKTQAFGEMSVKMADGKWLKVSRKYKKVARQIISK